MVWVTTLDAYECDFTDAWTPDYARELASALLLAADAAEKQKTTWK